MKIRDLLEGKGTKEQAGYIPRPKNGEKCINCTMWRDPNKCSAVAGNISPNGWCEWYAGGAYGKRGKRVNEAEGLGLTIFDIDETLMRTTAKIKVVKDGKVIRSLTNQEFNNYKLQPGEQFDFGEFRNAEKFRRESQPIAPMIAKLKAILRNAGDSKVIMLTARADFDDKETFLNTFRDLGIDMSRVHVHRAGNLPGNPAEAKAVWIKKYLDTGKYSRVRLYDDSMGNIKMFNALAKEYPNIKFFPYLVTHEGGIKTVREDGRIVKGVNTTVDVGPDEIKKQAAKFGNIVDKDGRPPTLSKKVKGKSTNVLYNLGLTESINPELLDKNFYKEKIIDTKAGQVKLVAKHYPSNMIPQIKVEALIDDKLVGAVRFIVAGNDEPVGFLNKFKKADPYLVAGNLRVEDEYQRKGIATAMYQFVKSMGNDIKPSSSQTDQGKAFWKSKPNESTTPRYTAAEWAIIEGGHSLEDQEVKTKLFDFDKY